MPIDTASPVLDFNTASKPSALRITDLRVADIADAPMRCPIIKISTNQGIEGYGEVRDGAHPLYALMLKKHLLGENPCDVDRLFKRIRQFGAPARQAGGVCGIEVALMDLAGKAYGVPAYMLLGGKHRDRIRIYCDTDAGEKDTGEAMGKALKARMDQGYTFLKMDLGVNQLEGIDGAVSAPLGFIEEQRARRHAIREAAVKGDAQTLRYLRHRAYDYENIPHPQTMIRVTKKGFEALEAYVEQARGIIGYDVPLAVDHFGHICLEDCIQLARRVERFSLAWLEDMIPWQYTEQWVQLRRASTTPVATGEDIYLKEDFRKLIDAGAVSIIHPDLLSAGGMLETKRIGDMASEAGVGVAVHMAESPVGCMAAAHTCAAMEHVIALEFHSNDVQWWQDMVEYAPGGRIVDHGWITVTDAPGLGITKLNDEILAARMSKDSPGLWMSTEEWDDWTSHDRLWS
ncbi:MAG: mandelate racemase/muconate lactonizing enzyme family protein [Oscillospiraceae bacterium]|nr:mandelate racemase/muconate lactonizing enzyme family protein [Oscillospiraceae bacterium]